MTKEYHRNPLLEDWEAKLQAAFNEVDHQLEDLYGDMFPLKPSRAKRGRAPTPDADGLFDLGVSFAAGFGSKFGPGYVFQIRMATLDHVPADTRARIEEEALEMVKTELARVFPGKTLHVERDSAVFKVFGDLSLEPG